MSRRAALSPQRELAFLVLLHDTLHKHKDAQFIISGHSPLLLGHPEAQILSFDGGKIHEIGYEDLQFVQIARRFLNHRQNFLQQLLNDPSRIPNEEQKKCGVFWRQSVSWRQLHAHFSCCLPSFS